MVQDEIREFCQASCRFVENEILLLEWMSYLHKVKVILDLEVVVLNSKWFINKPTFT